MGRVTGALGRIQEKANEYFYTCEFIKDCTKVTVQCRHGGSSYCGEYKKRLKKKKSK